MKRLLILSVLCIALGACRESLEERASRETKTYTEKNCPQQLDEKTRLDSVTFDTGSHTFVNYYTLDYEFSEAEKVTFKSNLLKDLAGDTRQQVYKDAGYSYRYVYRSKADPKTVVFDATFTKSDYK